MILKTPKNYVDVNYKSFNHYRQRYQEVYRDDSRRLNEYTKKSISTCKKTSTRNKNKYSMPCLKIKIKIA
jgi:hypothetical protein